MLRFYQGHIIITLVDERLSAEITERSTGVPFALKVSASVEEGEAVLIDRARGLIDSNLGRGVPLEPAFTRQVASRVPSLSSSRIEFSSTGPRLR